MFTSNWVASYLTISKSCLHSLPPVSHLPFTPQLATVWLLAPGILLKQLFTKINSNFLIFKSHGYFSVLIVPNHFLVLDIVNHSFPSWNSGFPCIWDTYSDFHSSWQFCLWFFVDFSFFYILEFDRIAYCFSLSLSELFHFHDSINTYKSLTAKYLSFIHISLKSGSQLPSRWL